VPRPRRETSDRSHFDGPPLFPIVVSPFAAVGVEECLSQQLGSRLTQATVTHQSRLSIF
jgi:hypothetical protein